jgi:hypothetical protein
MPYIPKEQREIINKQMSQILEHAGDLTEDELNYIICNLLNSCIQRSKSVNYGSLIGVLECAKLEFYNRMMKHYETQQMIANGRVYQPSQPMMIANEIEKQQDKIEAYKTTYAYHGCDSYEEYFRDNLATEHEILDGLKIGFTNSKDK